MERLEVQKERKKEVDDEETKMSCNETKYRLVMVRR